MSSTLLTTLFNLLQHRPTILRLGLVVAARSDRGSPIVVLNRAVRRREMPPHRPRSNEGNMTSLDSSSDKPLSLQTIRCELTK